ncbi:Hypothetical predicted protein [Mytilus galloprovincialis]|uniref:Ig-like domain-containing protein n=1 Tax=Mytilus galloprovincialis TaxID=29158 RepID=A0A8B6GHI4_MYTGA|nr:Hypothetical predicted protein [Mytilus galloprovincialis]
MVLQCPVNHKSLQWIKLSNDEELGTIYSEKRVLNRNLPQVNRLAITGNFSIGQYILNIDYFTKGDEGVYMCFVSNENRVQNYSIHVQLTKVPSNIRWLSGVTNYNGSNDKICIVQKTCNVTCIVDSGMPPEVLLISDDKHLYAVGGPDQPVVFLISLSSTDITEGSNVSIVCKSDANPKVLDLQLFKDGKSVLHTDSDYNSLDMKKFTRSHAGKYRCICRNIIGTGDDEIPLNVLYAPDVKIIANTSNGRVYLRCNANGYPKIYRYLLWEHKTLFGEHIRYLKGDSFGNVYLSENSSDAKYQNNGICVCKVENGIVNSIGNLVQMATKHLNTEEPPVFVSDNNIVQYGTSGKSTRIVTYIYGHPMHHILCCSSQNWTMCQDSHPYAFEKKVTLVRDTFHGVLVLLQGYQVSFETAVLQPVDSPYMHLKSEMFSVLENL